MDKTAELKAAVKKNREIVESIDLIDTIEKAFQEAAKIWRQRISALETQIATLQAIITEMNAAVMDNNKLLGNKFGADGKGSNDFKTRLAKWKEEESTAKKQPQK